MFLSYYIEGSVLSLCCSDIKNPHCIEEDRNFTGMPKFWDWLQVSSYEGTATIRHVVYDFWGTNVSHNLLTRDDSEW